MKSPVNWALLGLVIERASYAYELAQRFKLLYRDALSLSSASHVYTALGTLQSRSLIEEVPGPRTGRQPKPRYRATPQGEQSYGEWLVGYVREDRRRQLVFVLQLSALASNTAAVVEILKRCEQAWLAESGQTFLASVEGVADRASAEFIARALTEENRPTADAKLLWVRDVRRELEDLAAQTGNQDVERSTP
jgi:DNA-binding PadR family transcriptional regulator